MPTYEYKCEACGNPFEKFQSITAASIRKCPKCGKNRVKRLISTGAGLIFKGTGFYTTDYRSDSYKDAAKSEAGTKTDAAAKTDGAGKSETPAKTGTAAKGEAAACAAPATETKPGTKTKESKSPAIPESKK